MIPLLSHGFLFLRHGETDANVADRISGFTDDPLNARGVAQARVAATLLAGRPLAAIWHSPLVRAADTARAVAATTGAPLVPLPGLAERNWGIWEGMPRSTLIREATPAGGEGPAAFTARIRAALAAILPPFPVLIVGHSGTAREIHTFLTEAPFSRPDNAAPIEWRHDGRHWISTELSPNR